MRMTVMSDDQRGILCIVIGMFLFSMQDLLIKTMVDQGSLIQIVVMRGLIGGSLLLLFLRLTGRSTNVGSAYPLLSFTRAIMFYFGFLCFYFARASMPIAEATSLFFVSPFFLTILSRIVLKNPLGLYRIGAIIVGFMGMLLIIKPDPDEFNWVALLPVFCALTYSISMIIARYTREKDSVFQQTCHMYMGSIVFGTTTALMMMVIPQPEADLASISYLFRPWVFDDLFVLMAIGVISAVGTTGIILLISGYRVGNPAVIAPFEYTMLVIAIIVGIIFFGEYPDAWSLTGMGLIVGSGIFIFVREGIRKAAPIATKTLLRG